MRHRCTDCQQRIRQGEEFFIDYRYFGAEVCSSCREVRRRIDPDAFWWGMEWVHGAPPVMPILMFTWCVCAGIIAIALLMRTT